MRLLLAFVFLFGIGLPIASAQTDDLWGDYEAPETASFWKSFETDLSGQATLAAYTGEGSDLVFNGELNYTASRILATGTEIGATIGGRVQRDHIICPEISPRALSTQRLAGAFSTGTALPCDNSASLERAADTANIFVQARWGRVTLGRGQGVAAKYFRGPDAGYTHSGIGQAILNPIGINAIRARDDLSGRGAKLSVESPRILGTQIGVAHTFEGDFQGLDRDGHIRAGVEIDTVTEVAANFSHLFRDNGVRVRVAASASHATLNTRPAFTPVYDDVTTFATSGHIEKGDWDIGFSWLQSDNGLQNGEYESLTLGVGLEKFDWQWRAIYGESDNQATNVQQSLLSLNASHPLTDNARLTLGVVGGDISSPSGLVFETPQGGVVEISLNF